MNRMTKGLIGVGAVLSVAYLWPTPPAVEHPYFSKVSEPEIIAHGGGLGVRPANTLAALEQAVSDKADVLEIDVQLTKDNELVVLHDATLDRTTDITGAVLEMTLAEIKKANAGAHKTPAGEDFSQLNIRVPTLDEALIQFPDKRWVIEIKNSGTKGAAALCERIKKYGITNQVLAASFHDDAIASFREQCPDVATSSSSGESRLFVIAAKVGLSHLVPMDAVAMQLPPSSGGITVLDAQLLRAAKARGIKVHAWTINEAEEMQRLLDMPVDGVITDFVARGNQVKSSL
ncbi:glycerophosphodiester phosphodiesterase [Parendozoicomonas haliclonae]|uniref:Putative glycerophosphoryl diester phosphodiesterase 1 n=1 Tax=Parendozoicomonas haliclonae TaxID=1960125 RepID=A0A1X7ALG1_9GAMM|nr:glycerophosphodiester phosphodiesterase [Parendozoicomonas haliclonae]SMA48357.1 putative glycerophosphoryl diester phosphodiesterase 1 [Parendozoicomonas haliclonae]